MSTQQPRQTLDQALEALKLIAKAKEIKQQKRIAEQRHRLATEEFELLLSKESTPAEEIESARSKLISLYEQYIDAGLLLRQHSIESEKQIGDMMRGLNL